MYIFDVLEKYYVGPKDKHRKIKKGLFSSNSIIARIKFLEAVPEMLKGPWRFLFGNGINSWKLLYPRVAAELQQKSGGKYLHGKYFTLPVAEHTHNDFAEEIVELGFAGLCFCVVIFGNSFILCNDPFLGAALFASLVASLATFPLREAPCGLMIWIIAGLLCS